MLRFLGLAALDQVLMLCIQSQDMRFANGTTGRLFWWAPGNIDDKKSLPSSHPELLVPSRFVQVLFCWGAAPAFLRSRLQAHT